MSESLFFQDLAVMMAVVGLVSVVFTRLGWPKVIGYLLAGILMSGSIIRSIESDYTMYIRTVSILSWGISIAINGVLSFVINHISFKNIEKTPLTDIMKY